MMNINMVISKIVKIIYEHENISRFHLEIIGRYGDYWEKESRKELENIEKELENKEITIDENGIAYNCIGRVLMSDMAEKVALLTDEISLKNTAEARAIEVEKSLAEYRKHKHPLTDEMRNEMISAFGEGETVVDIITGETYHL